LSVHLSHPMSVLSTRTIFTHTLLSSHVRTVYPYDIYTYPSLIPCPYCLPVRYLHIPLSHPCPYCLPVRYLHIHLSHPCPYCLPVRYLHIHFSHPMSVLSTRTILSVQQSRTRPTLHGGSFDAPLGDCEHQPRRAVAAASTRSKSRFCG
jgi:hypothetical protein